MKIVNNQVSAKVSLELDTTDAEVKIKALENRVKSLDVNLLSYSSFRYKLNMLGAFALGTSVGTTCLTVAAAICNHFGWIN